jgi:hypothetical protein
MIRYFKLAWFVIRHPILVYTNGIGFYDTWRFYRRANRLPGGH